MDQELKDKKHGIMRQIEELYGELAELIVKEETVDVSENSDAQRAKSFNGLSAKEWASLSRSVWNDVSSVRQKKHLIHGATFPEKLCSRLIKMYTNVGDTVIDPFLGTGTTVIAALRAKRKAVGIELTQKYYDIAQISIGQFLAEKGVIDEACEDYQIVLGDCSEKLDTVARESVQLTITSPPYADLIHKVEDDRKNRHKASAFVTENNSTTNLYSNLKEDLGNMCFDEYRLAVIKIMRELYRVTKVGGYNIWVVKDYRDMKNELPYIDLHSAISEAGVMAGFKLQDIIIWDQNEHRKLVLLGYPSRFYVNQNHSYLVVLRKWK